MNKLKSALQRVREQRIAVTHAAVVEMARQADKIRPADRNFIVAASKQDVPLTDQQAKLADAIIARHGFRTDQQLHNELLMEYRNNAALMDQLWKSDRRLESLKQEINLRALRKDESPGPRHI